MAEQTFQAEGMTIVGNANERLAYFDGLRAILAFIVIFEHLMTVFFPLSMINDLTPGIDASFGENLLMFGPSNMLYAGYMAVSVFFVLSGYLLSQSLVKVANLVSMDAVWFVIRRYLRFAVPVLVMLIVAVAMARNGLFYFHEYQAEYGHAGYPIYEKDNLPTFLGALEGGLYRSIFMFEGAINPVLWTVSAEMLGSLMVLALLVFRQNKLSKKYRISLYITTFSAALFVLWDNVLIGFLVGVMCYEALRFIKPRPTLKKWTISVAVTVLILLSLVSVKGGPTNPITLLSFDFHATLFNYVIFAWFAGGLIVLLSLSSNLQAILSNNILTMIGKYSFGIYLTHYLILTSVGLRISHYFDGDTNIAFYISSLCTIILSIIVGGVFYHWVEKPVLNLSKKIRTGTRLHFIHSTDETVSTKLAPR